MLTITNGSDGFNLLDGDYRIGWIARRTKSKWYHSRSEHYCDSPIAAYRDFCFITGQSSEPSATIDHELLMTDISKSAEKKRINKKARGT